MDRYFEYRIVDGRAAFPAMLDEIEAFLCSSGAPADIASRLMVAFDEVISNILDHGRAADNAAGGAGPEVTVSIRAESTGIAAEVRDDGPSFDPLSRPVPDTTLPLEQRPIGGLGIHLVRELMDNVEYIRDGNKNLLRFAKIYS